MALVLSQLVVEKLAGMGCVLGCLKRTVTVEGKRYKMIRQIAEGGFSTVELVEDSETGKKFALKRILCHSIEDQNVALQEVKVTKELSHPNIVKVVGSSTWGQADILHNRTSEVLIVFPLYQRSLQDELESREKSANHFPDPVLLSLFLRICQAVKELHTSSPPLAHRDIKPHNILLTKDFSPVLMDFGSAALARVTPANLKEAAYLQDTAAERCSMTYRPPELYHVATGSLVDERTDIWSLGCLLFALMHFRGPFDAVYERGDSVALAVQSGTIQFPKENGVEGVENKCHQGLRDLIVGMTNLDINFRLDINSVIERVQALQEEAEEKY